MKNFREVESVQTPNSFEATIYREKWRSYGIESFQDSGAVLLQPRDFFSKIRISSETHNCENKSECHPILGEKFENIFGWYEVVFIGWRLNFFLKIPLQFPVAVDQQLD